MLSEGMQSQYQDHLIDTALCNWHMQALFYRTNGIRSFKFQHKYPKLFEVLSQIGSHLGTLKVFEDKSY